MSSFNDDDISFKGPSKEVTPPLGRTTPLPRTTAPNIKDYADQDRLKKLLEKVKKETNSLITDAEEELTRFNMNVSPGSKLEEAHTIEWPSELGDVKDYVSYAEYKALENTQSRSGTYIRKTYEDTIRGPMGTPALDAISLARAVHHEAVNIEEFLDDYVGDVSDASEKRTVELLQDWAENALRHTRNVRSIYQERGKVSPISASELGSINGERAAKYQALFKVRLNEVNNKIASLQEEITKNHTTFSDAYFKRFLGPAMNMRLAVTKDFEQALLDKGMLGESVTKTNPKLNDDLQMLLADQMRRNEIFNSKTEDLKKQLKIRDGWVKAIRDLEVKGKPLKAKFNPTPPTPTETETWSNIQPVVDEFNSSHSELRDRDADDAHEQYLLKAGDTITGDIEVEPGVTIDGVDINTHAHTGLDGSQKIRGIDLVGGTLPNSTVDTSDQPDVPTSLRLLSQRAVMTNPGTVGIEVTLAWDGDDAGYEVQIHRVED